MPRYTELGPIAAAMGVADDLSGEFKVMRDGLDITVSLRIDSGLVRGVDLHVKNPGWPECEFRREKDEDRRSKASGMNVEVQTGDKMFDDFVYIESPYAQQVLAPLLQSPALRKAIGDLVAQYTSVQITPSALTVDTRNAGTDLLEPARFMPLLQGVMTIAKLFPPVPAGAPKQSERGGGLVMVATANVLFSGAAMPAIASHIGDCDAWWVNVIGVGIGLVLALVSIPLVKIWTKGHSRSRRYWVITSAANCLGLPLFFMSGVVIANALLDFAPPENLTGKVTTAAPYVDDGDPRAKVTVAWSTHAPSSPAVEAFDVKDPRPVGVKVGDGVRAIRHPGALGFTWWTLKPEIVR